MDRPGSPVLRRAPNGRAVYGLLRRRAPPEQRDRRPLDGRRATRYRHRRLPRSRLGAVAEHLEAMRAPVSQLPLWEEPQPEWWCGYLAGLLDGEGYVGVGKQALQAEVAVGMCEAQAVAKLHTIYGGSLSRRRPQRANHRA